MTELPSIGKPAVNALRSIGFTTLEQVSTLDKASLLKIHGVGPKALAILEKKLAVHNLTFQTHSDNGTIPNTEFAVICSLNCDNAPKRRPIRDYLIAVPSGNQRLLASILSDSFCWIIPGENPLHGKEAFLKTVVKEQKDNAGNHSTALSFFA